MRNITRIETNQEKKDKPIDQQKNDINRLFTKKDIKMPNEKCSVSSVTERNAN